MIKELFEKKQTLSFEVFPPKKDDEFEGVYTTLDKLSELKPDFISVTYGAGGSRSKKTVEIADYIQNQLNIDAIAHMTCVGNRKDDIEKVCLELKKANVSHVLALRGDRPQYMTDEQYEAREFFYANELVEYLKENTSFSVAGAGYPEKHFEAESYQSDLERLKVKVDTGCDFLITQLFMDNDVFYRFRENCDRMNIHVPICAGIMPITSSKQVSTIISLSGTSIPKEFSDIVAKYGESQEDMRKAGIDYAIRQINELKKNEVDGIHIYSMNKPKMTEEIVRAIE